MITLAVILTILSSFVLAIWVTRHYMIYVENKRGLTLSADYPQPPGRELPFLSMMVAAKDEQENIGRCVSSLLRQDYPNFEVVVVNDRSIDRTREIVEQLAATDKRLRLINIEQLPPGWCGKNNAMQTGIAQTRGEWFCMTDADCEFVSPAALRSAVNYALDTGADLLSVLPTLEMRGFWENVIQPVCSGVMMIWFHPDKVNNPSAPHAYANGAFMVMKRTAYQAVGTHEAVKNQVNEDMHLAARVKVAGLSLRVIRNRGLLLARMYTSLKAILRGWSRIFYGTFGTYRRLTVSLAMLVVMGLPPYVAACVGLGGAALGGGSPLFWACGLVGTAAVVMQISVIYRFYRLVNGSPLLAWTYPLGCLAACYAVVNAMTKLRKGARVTWRNTSYTRT